MGEVLGQFAATRRGAHPRYRAFVAERVAQGRRRDLQGGGRCRSPGGWAGVAAPRRGRETYGADERILGSPAFVAQMRAEAEAGRPLPEALGVRPESV